MKACVFRSLVIVVGWIFSSAIFAAEISFMCGEGPAHDFELCSKHAQDWAKQTGNTVNMQLRPKTTNATLGLLQQFLVSESTDLDVFIIDVIWPGILGPYLTDLRPHLKPADIEQHFPALIANNTDKHNRLLALPFFTDIGLLYYRKDLLQKHQHQPPQTWEELATISRDILQRENNPKLQGFIWQGAAYEGLTCNALEWIASFGGGTILDADTGAVAVNNPHAQNALNTLASWMGNITPKDVLSYTEAETHRQFIAGNAIFMRNWPYAWIPINDTSSPVRGRVSAIPLPYGGTQGTHRGTLGGWGLAVSKFSRHPREATDLARYMASERVQLERALKMGFLPTIQRIYSHPELLHKDPIMTQIPLMLSTAATARPARQAGIRYDKLSNKTWTAVRSALSGEQTPQQALAALERDLNRLLDDRRRAQQRARISVK
jgi:trehalose/maltose transport system substrate-binding protein